jgi:hypothetical protein
VKNCEPIDPADQWAGDVAAQIREIDFVKVGASSNERAELVRHVITSGLERVSPDDRSGYLKKLRRRFPTFTADVGLEPVRPKPGGNYLEAKLEPVLEWLVEELKNKNTDDRQAVWDRFVEAGVLENMVSATLPSTLNYLRSVKSRLDDRATEQVREVLSEFGLPKRTTKDQTDTVLKWVAAHFLGLSPSERDDFWRHLKGLGIVPPTTQLPVTQLPEGVAIGIDLLEVRKAFGLAKEDSMDPARLDKLLAEMIKFNTQMFNIIWSLHRKLSKAPGAGKIADLKANVRGYLAISRRSPDQEAVDADRVLRDIDATKKACALAIELFGDIGGKFWAQAIQKLDPTVIEDSVNGGFLPEAGYWKEYKKRFKLIETRDRFQAEYELLFGKELNDSLKNQSVKIPQSA